MGRIIFLVCFGVVLAALTLCEVVAQRPRPRAIINPEVAREHQKLFRPSPVQTHPGIDYVSRIEQLGRPTWKHGRWMK
jgi:hypothetical protein